MNCPVCHAGVSQRFSLPGKPTFVFKCGTREYPGGHLDTTKQCLEAGFRRVSIRLEELELMGRRCSHGSEEGANKKAESELVQRDRVIAELRDCLSCDGCACCMCDCNDHPGQLGDGPTLYLEHQEVLRLRDEIASLTERKDLNIKVMSNNRNYAYHCLAPHSLTQTCFKAGCRPINVYAEKLPVDIPMPSCDMGDDREPTRGAE